MRWKCRPNFFTAAHGFEPILTFRQEVVVTAHCQTDPKRTETEGQILFLTHADPVMSDRISPIGSETPKLFPTPMHITGVEQQRPYIRNNSEIPAKKTQLDSTFRDTL